MMLRGMNQQIIFENDDDNLKIIEILIKHKEISEFKILSSCLTEQVDFRISDVDVKKIVEKISYCKTIVEYQKILC